ncbi:MAG TPA: hypothetical protein VHT05_10170 [Candidatus Elarobacter sp.]|jgi:hypothetical protein|nr:hypothetical protein [Candidatus Elarobacter sp.]
MRVKVEVTLDSSTEQQYADMFAPIDLAHGIPNAGDEIVLDDVPYVCTRRRFRYDIGGRLTGVTIYVKR